MTEGIKGLKQCLLFYQVISETAVHIVGVFFSQKLVNKPGDLKNGKLWTIFQQKSIFRLKLLRFLLHIFKL